MDELFKKKGAPFISGASGTIEHEIFDLRRAAEQNIIPKNDIEKWIIIVTASLILGGHHSLSEAFIVAKHNAFDYFKCLTDPRENYIKFVHELSLICKKYNLHSSFPILSNTHAKYLVKKGLYNLKNQVSRDQKTIQQLIKKLLSQLEDENNLQEIIETINTTIQIMNFDKQKNKEALDIFNQTMPYFNNAQDLIFLYKHEDNSERSLKPLKGYR